MLSSLRVMVLLILLSFDDAIGVSRRHDSVNLRKSEMSSHETVMNPLLRASEEYREADSSRDFVMCSVNQPSNDWEMIREFIQDDMPFVLAVQDFNPKRDGLPNIAVIAHIPFPRGVLYSSLLTRGTVAVVASPSFLELYDVAHVYTVQGDATPTTVKGTVNVDFKPRDGTFADACSLMMMSLTNTIPKHDQEVLQLQSYRHTEVRVSDSKRSRHIRNV